MTQTERPVALVTGGGSGIGAAIARALSADYRVAICGRRIAPLQAIAAEMGGLALQADLSLPQQSFDIVDRVVEHFGRLDALVLNAGIVEPAPVAEMPLESWQRQIMVNLTSPFLTAQAALPHLARQKGAIVGIASAAARHTGAGLAAYGVPKAGMVRLIQSIAFECAGSVVRANRIARSALCGGKLKTLPR